MSRSHASSLSNAVQSRSDNNPDSALKLSDKMLVLTIQTSYMGGLSPMKLKSVIDYMHLHLDQEMGLEELAAIARLSPYHFCRSFKRSTGFTPHQYLIRQRVEMAKLLLKDGKMEILEVAMECGFTHQSHLNRHFKRLTGVTPKLFSQQQFVQHQQDCTGLG